MLVRLKVMSVWGVMGGDEGVDVECSETCLASTVQPSVHDRVVLQLLLLL